MKFPHIVSSYCPKCRTHTEQEVEKVKKRPASELKWGQRRFRRATSGYGGFPRPKPDREKPTKRIFIKFKCKVCKKEWPKRGWRAKRFEIVE